MYNPEEYDNRYNKPMIERTNMPKYILWLACLFIFAMVANVLGY